MFMLSSEKGTLGIKHKPKSRQTWHHLKLFRSPFGHTYHLWEQSSDSWGLSHLLFLEQVHKFSKTCRPKDRYWFDSPQRMSFRPKLALRVSPLQVLDEEKNLELFSSLTQSSVSRNNTAEEWPERHADHPFLYTFSLAQARRVTVWDPRELLPHSCNNTKTAT